MADNLLTHVYVVYLGEEHFLTDKKIVILLPRVIPAPWKLEITPGFPINYSSRVPP